MKTKKMKQKTKLYTIIVAIFIITLAVVGLFIAERNKQQANLSQPVIGDDQPQQNNDVEKSKIFVEGKAIGMNEKKLYVELSDGKGSEINIKAETPVRIEGVEKVGNLGALKLGMTVKVSVNEKNDAIEILIKK